MGRFGIVGARPTGVIAWIFFLSALSTAVLAGNMILQRRAPVRWLAAILATSAMAIACLPFDYVSQKAGARLLMPAGLLFLVLFGASAALFFDHKRKAASVCLALTLAHWASGSGFIGAWLLDSLESQVPPFVASPTEGGRPRFEAVLVLGGGTKRGPKRHELGPAGDRVMLGATLYFGGYTERLIASGRGIPGLSNENMAAQTESIWRGLGIPAEKIVTFDTPVNTSQEITALAEWARKEGISKLGVVSSAWHLPRALATARTLGIDVVPIPADHRAGMPPFGPVDLIPSADGFQRVQIGCWEWIGRAVGR